MKNCKIIILLNLFTFFAFSSCSSLFTIGTATVVVTSWYDSRTIGTQIDDNILKINIYKALKENEKIRKKSRIVSIVYQGNILFVGQSPSFLLSQEVIKIASGIEGVKNIYNAIRLGKTISFQKILLDFFLSNQIRLSLFIHENINLSKIKVISENQEVFLLGVFSESDGIIAKNIAKNKYGVKNVFVLSYRK